MGFFRRLFGGDDSGPQRGGVDGGADGDGTGGGRHRSGTARVVACSSYNGDGIFQSCTLNLVVQVEGLAPYSTEHHQFCSRRKWPYPGMVLPVRVRADDPHSVKLDFDAVPDDATVARQAAEQQAAMLRGETPGGGPGFVAGLGGSVGADVQFVGGTPADLPPDKRARLEQFLGVDLDGDGVVGPNPAASAPPAAPGSAAPGSAAPGPDAAEAGGPTDEGADRIGQLERLARLHADGALTDEEFAAEKRRVLGG
jgi:hypothetical protein